MSRSAVRSVLSLVAILLAAGSLPALQIPGQIELTLESGAEELQRFRQYGQDLSASDWPEVAALGDLVLSMVEALEGGRAESFVAARAIYHYRIGKMSDDVKVEILRAQLATDCFCPQVDLKGCPPPPPPPPPSGCTPASCNLQCFPTGGLCTASGRCACF